MDGRENENKTSNTASQPIFTPPVSNNPDKSANSMPAPIISMPTNNQVALASSAQGDIILNNGPQKSKINKKTIIIGLIAVVVTIVIVAIIVLLISLFSKPNSADVLKDFKRYQNYIEYGNENPDPNDLKSIPSDYTWTIFDMTSSGFTTSEQNTFSNNAERLYKKFAEARKKSKLDYRAFISDNFSSDLDSYELLLNYILNYNNMQLRSEQLLQDYLKNGEESARKMISKYFYSSITIDDLTNGSPLIDTLLANLRQYYNNQIDLFGYYSENNCITDEQLSNICVSLIRDPSYSAIQEKNSRIKRGLEYAHNDISIQFRAYTVSIEGILEEMNER